MRTTRETVVFDTPFRLSGLDEEQPAGAYTVVTDEDLIEGLSFLAYRRVATTIYLPLPHGGSGSTQAVTVDPARSTACGDRNGAGPRPSATCSTGAHC